MIGVSLGTPTEFRFLSKRIDDQTPLAWSPKQVEFAIRQDDLYVDMVLAAVMDKLGLDATTQQFGEAFKQTKFRLWHANAGARKNLNRGIPAPQSGLPKNNIHANDIDFQIECDFIGLMCPGLPREVAKYCDRVGRVMNYGDGVYGGMYIGGMYAAAFFESDPRKVVEAGLACLPPQSHYAAVIRDVLAWRDQYPGDWRKAWQALEDKYDKNDSCSDGALQPFNIDASFNGGFVAIGLLYGGGDFGRTIEIATRCGQDSDCNPCNAGGILGTVLGYEKIPDEWKGGIAALDNVKFEFTEYSLNEICESTLARALKVVEGAGGMAEGDRVRVATQSPQPPPLEQWTMGIPDRLIDPDDPAWKLQGRWARFMDKARGRVAAFGTQEAGAEATLAFSGSAIALVGRYSQQGGRADVYLDGKPAGMIDAYIVPLTTDDDLWHAYGLAPGEHALRIVSRADRDERSEGNELIIFQAIQFK